jgi:hypothetical protein
MGKYVSKVFPESQKALKHKLVGTKNEDKVQFLFCFFLGHSGEEKGADFQPIMTQKLPLF